MQTCISILKKIERQKFKHYKELQLDQFAYGSFVDSTFEWACDCCLENKKAILATPGLQESPFSPHLAYCDTQLYCSSCKKEFQFRKEEKKAWYESYKLPIKAQPSNCLNCRRNTQNLHDQNKTLSELLKKPEIEMTKDELDQVIGIYTLWNKMEKVKYYQSILKKRKDCDR